jgi:hypothetical protein
MIGDFETSKSFNIREREYRCLWPVIKIAYKLITTMHGVSSVVETERNVLQMPVTNQQGSIQKIFPLKLMIKAVCIRFSNLVILFLRKFALQCVSACFETRVPWFFESNKRRQSYPCNRLWRPIELWDVEAPTFSRQSAQKWRWDCQPYAPVALCPQEDSWYSFLYFC